MDNKMADILIYQMGKTAGNTIRKTLISKRMLSDYVHFLSDKEIESRLQCYNRRGVEPANHWKDSVRVANCLKNLRPNFDQLRMISTFREPIGRTISCVFEDLDNLFPELHGRDDDQARDRIFTHLTTHFTKTDPSTEFTCCWFKNELYTVTGIDVYQLPFNHERGFILFEQFGARVLIMKYERLREIFSAALSSLLETDISAPVNSNVSEQKHYARLYKRIQREYSLDERVLTRYYETSYMKHFYTDDEIQGFINQWTGRRDNHQRLIELAEKHLASGSYANAAQTCRQILDIEPESSQASFLLARLFLKTGQDHLAIREYRKILSRNPFDREVVIESSKLLTANNMADNAFTLCVCYLEKNPEDFEVRNLAAAIQNQCLSVVG